MKKTKLRITDENRTISRKGAQRVVNLMAKLDGSKARIAANSVEISVSTDKLEDSVVTKRIIASPSERFIVESFRGKQKRGQYEIVGGRITKTDSNDRRPRKGRPRVRKESATPMHSHKLRLATDEENQKFREFISQRTRGSQGDVLVNGKQPTGEEAERMGLNDGIKRNTH